MICDEEYLKIIREKISRDGKVVYESKDNSLCTTFEQKDIVIENGIFSAKTKIVNLEKIVWKDGEKEVIFPNLEILKDFNVKIYFEERIERYGHWSHMPYYFNPMSEYQPQYCEVDIPRIYNILIITNKSLS